VLGLPRGSLGDPQGFLACRFEGLHANLHEGFHFRPIARTVRADGLLPHFGKEKRVVSGAFGAACATSRRWQQGFVLRVKRRVRDVQMDFALNPLAEFPHGDRFGLLVFQKSRRGPVLRETFGEGAALIVRLQSGHLKRMRDGQLSGVESLLDFVHEVHQAQPRVDVFFGAPDFLGEGLDRVGIRLQLHEGSIAACFIQLVHIGALQVLDQLQFEAFGVR
jgi:hypothetical protein